MRGWNGSNRLVDKLIESYESDTISDKNLAYAWGVYDIVGDSLRIEKWYSTDFFAKYRSEIYYGKILDSVTIKLDGYSSGGSIFSFYSLNIKPDSTNNFIK